MIINKEEIIKIFTLSKTGQKGWFIGGPCPYCGRDKLAIIFDSEVPSFICKRCSQHGSLYLLLQKINKIDLISLQPQFNIFSKLIPKLKIKKEEISCLPPKTVPLPLGFNRILGDEYLEKERGFIEEQFKVFTIGCSSRKEWEDYIIFIVIEGGECKGYLGRSKKNKKWIDLYNKKMKERGINKFYLRWKNSKDDFGNLIFGIDEITLFTKIVILVEGITSKANIDILLNLYSQEEIKCVATFGKKITLQQMKKIQDKGVENIILLYDPDAIDSSKQYSLELNKYFNTKIGFITFKKENRENKDPGDLNVDELFLILNKLEDPIKFNSGKVQPNLYPKQLFKIF